MGRKHVISILALTLLVAGIGCGGSQENDQSGELAAAPRTSYNLGERFDRIPLTAVLTGAEAPGRASFIYGDCVPPPGDGGCAPPLEVQSWSLCQRPPHAPLGNLDRIRGVPTDRRGGGLEVYTGDTTIVIFGAHGRAKAAAGLLRRAGDEGPPSTFDPPKLKEC